MASRAKRQHELGIVVARHPTMNGTRPPSALRGGAARYSTKIPVAGQHDFPVAAKVVSILPLECVARRAQALRQDVLPATGTVHRTLSSLPQTCPCSASMPSRRSTATQPSFQGSVRSGSNGMPFTRASSPESYRLPQVSSVSLQPGHPSNAGTASISSPMTNRWPFPTTASSSVYRLEAVFDAWPRAPLFK